MNMPPAEHSGEDRPTFTRLIVNLFAADWAPTKRFAIAGTAWLIAVAIYAGLTVHGFLIENPDRWFQEGKPGTILSTIVLFIAAGRAFRAHRCVTMRAARRFWLALSIALLIAGIDELFKLHEHVEIWYHQIFGIDRKESLYERIDEYLVAMYPLTMAVFGLLALRDLLSFTSTLRWWLFGGVCFALMLAMDMGKLSFPTPDNGGLLWEELSKSLAGAGVLAGVLSAIPPGAKPVAPDPCAS